VYQAVLAKCYSAQYCSCLWGNCV